MLSGIHYCLSAYFYTPSKGCTGVRVWEITQSVIAAAEAKGVLVKAIISDMGGANTGLWTAAGIKTTR